MRLLALAVALLAARPAAQLPSVPRLTPTYELSAFASREHRVRITTYCVEGTLMTIFDDSLGRSHVTYQPGACR